MNYIFYRLIFHLHIKQLLQFLYQVIIIQTLIILLLVVVPDTTPYAKIFAVPFSVSFPTIREEMVPLLEAVPQTFNMESLLMTDIPLMIPPAVTVVTPESEIKFPVTFPAIETEGLPPIIVTTSPTMIDPDCNVTLE